MEKMGMLTGHRYMIYGIGIDIVKIERMKDVVRKWGERFLKRVFTKSEISYCFQKREPYFSLAVRFAAKEALVKAVGSAFAVSLTDIEVMNMESGKPCITVKGKLKEIFNGESINRAHLSLSHEHEYGVACVVLECHEKAQEE
jgi:holo-[acyl-carrier-protein] synthase